MKRLVVVLGAGRSGTSLLMNLIANLGVSVSDNLVGPNQTNKKGAFEDQEILKISRGILRHYHRNGSSLSFLPMPENWLDDDFLKNEREKLKAIVEKQTEKNSLWGFKEPVTAKLLPMWEQVFNELELNPVYFLSLRHPSSVSDSFRRAYGVPQELSSLIWISRYTDAIINTEADLYVYDYDDWFDSGNEEILRLVKDLGVASTTESISVANNTIDENLNTSSSQLYVHDTAIELYNSIIEYRDQKLSRSALIERALDAREYLLNYEFFSYSVDLMGEEKDNLLGKLKSSRRSLYELKNELNDSKLQKSDPFTYIKKKREIPYKKNWKVVAGVASFKARENVFKKSISSVKDQFDHIYVYLNGYGKMPDFLDDPKFTVFLSENFVDLSANGKIFSLGEIGSCYFFTLDDDIFYPQDYVKEMIGAIKRYGGDVGVTVHGSILPDEPEWYYERYSLYPFQRSLEKDKFVNLVGSGTFAFHTDVLKTKAEDFFPHVMVDLQFSILAKQQCIPLVAIARPEKWLTALVQGEGLYQDFLFRKTIHTEKVIEYGPWGFSVYADIVSKKLPKWKEDESFLMDKELVDVEFFESLKNGGVPSNWCETDLYYSKIEEREFVKQPLRLYKQVKRLVNQNKNRYDKETKKLVDKNKKYSNELRKIKNSRAYKFSFYLSRAIKKPGWETVKFPIRIARLLIRK